VGKIKIHGGGQLFYTVTQSFFGDNTGRWDVETRTASRAEHMNPKRVHLGTLFR
jgi:hypothetical protein